MTDHVSVILALESLLIIMSDFKCQFVFSMQDRGRFSMLGLGDIVSICHLLIVSLSSLEKSVILFLLKSCKQRSYLCSIGYSVLSVRPGSRQSSSGYSLANHRLYSAFSTEGKGALGHLLPAPAGDSKRETPTSNLTESTGYCFHDQQKVESS